MRNISSRKGLVGAFTASLALSLGACGSMPSNRSLDSIHQPVVSQTSYTLDLTAGPAGLSIPEQRRLSGWFEAMDLRFGDKVYVDDPAHNPATHSAVEAVASKYAMLVSDDAPVTAGVVNADGVRVVVVRTTASVSGCPDWSNKSDTNLGNGTYSNFGCAINSNMAAMVADPSHLIKGANGTGTNSVSTGTKAIDSLRNRPPTGEQGLKATSSKES